MAVSAAASSTPLVLVLPQPSAQLPLLDDSALQPLRATPPPPPPPVIRHYRIQPGDTLEKIFLHFNIPLADLHDVLQADEAYLVLDVIQPDSELSFEFDPDGVVFQSLSLQPKVNQTVTYQRSEQGFVYSEVVIPTQWNQHVVRADISHSLYGTILETGLSDRDAMEITHLLGNKVNFQRDLRPGDTFDAVVSDEYMGDQATGERRLDAIKLNVRGTDYVAILFEDGNYYDEQGNSLTPALLRYPTSKHYRVSSPFDPKRFHPVTHRFAPHNGVDFATPSGTAVLATGDGVVTRVANHPYAGLYVVIDNDGPFSTRFLHLGKVLVHKGQRIKRGQKIALSGNSGRTTGPHLHYELHINNRPVNPLTAKIPTLVSVAAKDRGSFDELVGQYMPQLARQDVSDPLNPPGLLDHRG
nr:peptidoglycan DD-metalloendopeptidase family protein [Oceanobacter mangrovi]